MRKKVVNNNARAAIGDYTAWSGNVLFWEYVCITATPAAASHTTHPPKMNYMETLKRTKPLCPVAIKGGQAAAW
ncbi:predicted protein [Lichtheimia corymbifera JMRC:FSU:9682]|uniref:Uncharacterized protein n=1 Tax=Lichtheimia corymbifera JMRC:FSU:9682 TaxID=1263082 RepID=A0A068SG50_9FUNG|nr:predicted protein [Lichtheimia corymbifera JMRC:FSU:9682]